MNAAPTARSQEDRPSVAEVPAGEPRLPASDIDASLRWPLLKLFTGGLLWLAVGTVLALIASIKLHGPGFLADCPMLTLGRVRPAAMNCFLYGFASQIGLGVMLWMLCRLGGNRFAYGVPVFLAGKLWNIGVLVGVWAILAGASTGHEWLEMPRYAAGILFVAYAVIGLCAVGTFAQRRERTLYPSQWFLLLALFWFPWMYSAANWLLVIDPVRGVLQAAVNGWFTGNLLQLWLAPLGLAAVYYFLPRLTGQPLHSRELAAFALWTQALFAGGCGLTPLLGGPVPSWLGAVATASNVLLLVPLLATAMNWHLTQLPVCCAWKKDDVLRFIVTGAFCFLASGVLGAVMALPRVAEVTNFTYAVLARHALFVLGFVGTVLFGALYYIVPRLLQSPWPRPHLIQRHFLCWVVGLALIVLPLLVGGVIQGLRLNNPDAGFVQLVKGTAPFAGLYTLGLLVLLAGQGMFLVNLAGALRTFSRPMLQAVYEWTGCCAPTAKGGAKS
jgi:cytochrome c oxidase cbb3-type subunit 1